MRASFWSEPVRLWLLACGRQDLVDRGDQFAERVTALLVAVSQRAEQYLSSDDLYSGAGGELPSSPAEAGPALAAVDQFVNVRLREELSVLEAFLATFDDLRSRPAVAPALQVVESLTESVVDPNLAGFARGQSPDGSPSVLAMTVTDPGPGCPGLFVAGHPFSVVRAPRSLRRHIFASGSVRGAVR
jgi:hypothetical protein